MIIYCLDNSSFNQADSDGVISQIAKLADNKYHVMGELIVAHEITMVAAVANLKRILAVCGDRQVFIITPLLRFVNFACCDEAAHCTHRLVLDSALKLYMNLVRLHKFIEGRLSSFPLYEVIPVGDFSPPSTGPALPKSWPPTPVGAPSTGTAAPTPGWLSPSWTRSCEAPSSSRHLRPPLLTEATSESELNPLLSPATRAPSPPPAATTASTGNQTSPAAATVAVQEVAKPATTATETALPTPPAVTASTSSATAPPAAPPAAAQAAAAVTTAVTSAPVFPPPPKSTFVVSIFCSIKIKNCF